MKVVNTAGQMLVLTGAGAGGAGYTAGFSTQGNTLGNTGMVTGQLLMVGTNNITLSGSTNAGSITVSISGASQSVQTQAITVDQLSLGASTGGNTAGNTTVQTGQRFVFVGSNMISLSQATGAGSTTLTFNATQSVQTQGITADELSIGVSTGGNTQGNTTVNSGQRFVLVGTNGITLSQATGAGSTTISISGNAAQTNQSAIGALGVSNTGNTAGNTGVSTGIDWVIAGSNGITASESTAGGGPNTIWISGATQTNQSAIKGFGASNTGNTLGNTGISTGIDWVIAGTNNITVSESTVGGGPNTIWLSGPNAGAGNVTFSAGTSSGGFASIVFSNSNGVSWGLNGSTVTASAFTTHQFWVPSNSIAWTQASSGTLGIGTVEVQYSMAPAYISASAAQFLASVSMSTSSNSSYSINYTASIGVYTRNVSTLSLASSGSKSYGFTITSNNSTSLNSGWRLVTVPINLNVTPGDYWIAYMSSTASTNANWATIANAHLASLSTNIAGPFGAAGNASNQFVLGNGYFTSTSTALPVSMAFSHISSGQLGGLFSRIQGPFFNFYNFSA